MGYTEITVIVGGAVDEDRVFTTEETQDMDAYLARIKCEDFSGELAEIFRLYHSHEQGECECAQYVTDHAPWWTNRSPEWPTIEGLRQMRAEGYAHQMTPEDAARLAAADQEFGRCPYDPSRKTENCPVCQTYGHGEIK